MYDDNDDDDDDDDDFKMKKISETSGENKNCTKREQTTRKRRVGIAQLNVQGGNPRKRTHHESSTSSSEIATNTKRHPPSTGPNSKTVIWNNGQFPDLEFFHLSSKPQRGDKVESREPKERSLCGNKNETRFKNVNALFDSRKKHKESSPKLESVVTMKAGAIEKVKDSLNEDTESSGSQTSEFELRLSDSLSDDDDFTSKEQFPRINQEPQKLESFYITKQASTEVGLEPFEESYKNSKQSKSRNTEILDEDTKVDIELSSGIQTGVSKEIKSNSRNFLEVSPCKPAKKDTEESRKNIQSRKRKRIRSKKATCLVFSHLGNHDRGGKTNITETEKSQNLEKCAAPGQDTDETELRSKVSLRVGKTDEKECSGNPENIENKVDVPAILEKTETVKKTNKAKRRKSSRVVMECSWNPENIENKVEVPAILEKTETVKKTNKAKRCKSSRVVMECSGNPENIENKVEVAGILKNTETVKKANKAKRRQSSRNCKDGVNKIPGERVLLDACIKLEKIPLKELKYRNTRCFPKDDVFPKTEMREDLRILKDTLKDDEIDSLYQMAMLSPGCVVESVKYESPPLPLSPSFNLTSDDQSLADVKFTGKDKSLDVCVDKTSSNEQTAEDFPISFISEDRLKTFQSGSNSRKDVVEKLNSSEILDEGGKNLGFEHHNNLLDAEEILVTSSMVQENGTPESLPNYTDHFDDVVIKESPEEVSIQDHQELPDKMGCRVSVLEVACVPQEMSTRSGMDIREEEVGESGDKNAISPGIDAVCDSFSEDERKYERPSERDSFNFDQILKHIENQTSENRRSFNKDTIDDIKEVEDERSHGQIKNMVHRDIESPSLFEDQDSSGEMNQSYDNSGGKDIIKPLLSGIIKTANHSIAGCSNDQDISNHKLATDEGNSSRQATIDSQNEFEKSSEKSDHTKIWRPATQPPSPSYVSETRRVYGLPNERHPKAFCSDPKDLPSTTRSDWYY